MRYLVLLFYLLSFSLSAQEFVELDMSNHCSFNETVEDELFSFDTEVRVMDDLVAAIIEWGGVGRKNFTLIQCNVPNFAAVIENDKRYILWSQDFLEKAKRHEAIAALAHEIGHHLNEHSLDAANLESEELEADYYMGFVVSRASIPKSILLDYMSTLVAFQGKSAKKRRAAALNGYKQSELSLEIKGLAWNEDDPKIQKFIKKEFKFPRCYQEAEIDRAQIGYCANLGAVAKGIQRELKSKGFNNKSFMSVPGGFALITRLEQYTEQGKSEQGSYRWKDTPIPMHFEFSMNYFRSLIFQRACNLRVFVFVVTSENFGAGSHRVSKDEAEEWLHQSVNGLPAGIAAEPFSSDFKVHALVYEFKVPETDHRPKLTCPMDLDAETHLKGAGLFEK